MTECPGTHSVFRFGGSILTFMSDVPWLNDDEQYFWRMLLAAFRGVERTVDYRFLETAGVSSADFAVLVALAEAPDERQRMRELCVQLAWDRSRVSHQITRMEKRGLVEKVRCDNDNRGIDVALTSAGRELLEKAAPDHFRTVRSVVFDEIEGVDFAKNGEMLRRIAVKAAEFRGEEPNFSTSGMPCSPEGRE